MADSTATSVPFPSPDCPAAIEVGRALDEPSAESRELDATAAVEAQQKYSEERSKRIRSDGTSQYIDLSISEKFKHFQADPWVDTESVGPPPLTDGSECKFLILGAGFGGLLFAVRLIQAGYNVNEICIVDSAGGFGGTWYWNRYPGLMCDVESYIYLPLLEEMDYMPKHKYAYSHEIREYADMIADKWGLRSRAIFRAKLEYLTWNDSASQWRVKIKQEQGNGDNLDINIRSNFVFAASGLLDRPQLPDLPGIEDFQGHSFHPSRWDYLYTGGSPADPSLVNLKDKNVGIIGTGATAVQAIPHLARWAKRRYVFQRTPSAVDRRDQRPTDSELWTREIRSKRGWQKERMENFNAYITNTSPRPPTNMVNDGWSQIPSYSALIGGPAEVTPQSIPAYIASLHALDLPRQARVRARVDEVVEDKATAAQLKAWYPSWCKRPCFHDDYLPAFNLPHVTLVDTNGKGVDRVTPHGLVVQDTEYKLDLLIFSTGFRTPGIGSPASRAGIVVTGRGGRTMDEKWAEGVATLHGICSHDFPNLFWPGPNQASVSGNQTYVLDLLATHVAYVIAEAEKRVLREHGPGKGVVVEPTVEAEEEWSMRVLSKAAAFAAMVGCTPSYLNREGEMERLSGVEQIKAARASLWGEGIASYVKILERWRDEGLLRGLQVTAV